MGEDGKQREMMPGTVLLFLDEASQTTGDVGLCGFVHSA